jgi:hypothetical protein
MSLQITSTVRAFRRLRKPASGLGALFVCASLPAALPFSDDFESGLGQWTAGSPWGLTTARYASPNRSVTDSPGTFYTNNTDAALTLTVPVNLTGAIRPALGFHHQYALETGYDFGRVEISLDGGSSWSTPPLATYTGNRGAMTREQLDLTPYAGTADFRVRFRLVTDSSVAMDGWYVDDVSIAEAPEPVTLQATQTNRNSVGLAWTPSAAPDFAAYRIYRSSTAGVDWRSARLIMEFPTAAVTSAIDLTVSPKTKYFYRAAVVSTNGLVTLGNEIAVTTHPGMDYPFLDNGEGGPNTWVADAPWALSDEDAVSPTQAWSDSPGTNYANGIGSQALTLAAPMSFAGQAVAPVLSFNHKFDFAAGDSGYAEISLNNGADWTALASFTGNSAGQWRRARLSLAAYTNAPSVLVRFRLTTDPSATADGWHIDDISVAESPQVVLAPVLDQITSHTLRVSWPASTDPQFAQYAVFRSTAPGVGINSTGVALITNQATTSLTDTGLALDTDYYYRVYAVNGFGTFSPDSTTESSARTLNNPLPFSDDFEGTLLGWNCTGTWGRTTNEARSGLACLSDSPGFNYVNNSDSFAQTAVNLTGSVWPVLKFWDKFRLADNDWARLEVSTDGSGWTPVYGAAGVQAEWREQTIDLSPWKNQSNLRIRFHVWTDGSGTDDGWSIDDLAVVEHTPVSVSLPFYETFESGLANWLHSSWAVDTNGPFGGSYAVRDTPSGRMNPDTQYWLALGGELNLMGATNPQMVFWVRGQLWYRSRFRLQYSTDGGLTWPELTGLNNDWNQDWTRMQVSLQSLTNRLVRLRFVTWNEWGTAPAQDLWIDNVVIQEMPAPVTLQTLTPGLRSVELQWTPSTLGAAFQRYEVYRSTTPGVDITHTRIGSFTNAAVTNLTDSGLLIGATYYYRVFTVDTNDVFSPSNERSTTTVPVVLPLSDAFDTMDQWVTTGGWGVAADGRNGGCLSDSPIGDYGNNTDTYALTAVNLTGSAWPVLKFWDKFRLADNDWARLEVSTDGSGWTPVYGAAGVQAEWREQTIDLSPWKNQSNLRIRFHVWTDGSGTDDGWSIDDLAVVEHTPVSVSLPFYETFESGLENWLHSSWAVDTNGPFGGSYAVRDTPSGRMNPDTQYWLALGGELNLMGATNPQMVFWVRGQLWYRSRFRLQYSTDGGLTWPELTGLNYDWNQDWTRMQVSLQSLTNRLVRLRFVTWNEWGTAPAQDLWLDNVVIQEMPAPVTLQTLTPGLRSVELQWTPSTLGSTFKRYEVYRSTSANVDINQTLIGTFTDPGVTNLTDSGLLIGATYYYRVFTVDTNDVFSPSNERSTTTVPVVLPLSDAFDTTDQWVTTGSWGVAADGRSGGCLSDSPIGDYANSTDTYALTAVNLTGSVWPVLRFWDKFRLADNDWARLEVSTDGSGWTPIYGAAGVQAEWREQSIDLSPWKNQSNLRIRFHVWTDGGGTDDGWSIDDLAVVEHTPVTVGLPFYETFESGLGNWLHSSWAVDTNGPFGGSYAVRDTPAGRMNPDTQYWLGLGGELNLMGASNPQMVFWVRGQLWYRSRFRLQYSTDGGLTWPELTGLNNDWNQDWSRMQVSLQSLTNRLVRLRFATWNEWGTAPAQDLWIDNIAIEESPPPVSLNPLTEITSASMRLNWTEAAIPNFKAYRVYRSEAADVSESSVLLAVITNQTATTFIDTGLVARKTYYYRVYLYNQNDIGVGSNQASAMTAGVGVPWTEDFETNQSGWTFTGSWTRWPGAGRNGSTALVDSPGDYDNNASHYAQFAVDLRGLNWPVLRFWDRHAIANGDWGRLYVSGDGGGSWTCVYGVSDLRPQWAEQTIDLSPWKNSGQVWLRFQMHTDGGTQEDGWALDDIALMDHAPGPAVYPIFEDFEQGLDNWLHSSWTRDTNSPLAGSFAVRDTVSPRMPPDTQLALVLGRELNLTNAANPALTFWMRGQLWYRSRFRAQASTDGGVNWSDLVAYNYDWNQNWTRVQVPLTTYTNRSIRLRFIVWNEWGTAPDQDLFLDNIGIGEPSPSAPTLAAPAHLDSVTLVRPQLVVTNALDFQGDPLTYRFEVYADPALANLVAQVPAVASGAGTTAWAVDTDLPNNAQYWWRCQASDGTNTGPWMATATFFVNEINRPPTAPEIAGPPPGTLVTNLDALLLWFPSTDPDEGDSAVSYQIQVAADATFLLPFINVTNIPAIAVPSGGNWAMALPLNALPGADNLVSGTLYYWRINAQDRRGLSSAWSQGWNTFQFGIAPPRAGTITGFRCGAGNQMVLEWTDAAGSVFVEFSHSLNSPQWHTVAGPLQGTNWTFTPIPGTPSGFFRLRSE